MTPVRPATGDRRRSTGRRRCRCRARRTGCSPSSRTVPSTSNAHEKCRPTTTAIAPVTPITGTGRRRVDDGAVAELTFRVVAPALDRPVAQQRARVVRAGRDRGHAGAAGDAAHRAREPSRSTSELFPSCPASSAPNICTVPSTSTAHEILRAGADRGDAGQIAHRHRNLGDREPAPASASGFGHREVAELARRVQSPALHRAADEQRARVRRARRDRGRRRRARSPPPAPSRSPTSCCPAGRRCSDPSTSRCRPRSSAHECRAPTEIAVTPVRPLTAHRGLRVRERPVPELARGVQAPALHRARPPATRTSGTCRPRSP